MASTILVNSLKSQSGTEVEVPTGFTLNIADTGALKVNDVAITVGSSNIARKTADYTIVSGDVSGKSELVISCNAASSNRTITLPAVATSGLSTCIITIVADATATSTYKLLVQDSSSAEVWTGYAKSDYVRLVVSNGVWLVIDHQETLFSSRYMAANQSVTASALVQLTGTGSGWTNITDSGNMFDNVTNYQITMPCAGFANIQYFVKAGSASLTGAGPSLKAGTAGSPTLIWDTEYGQGNGYHRSYDTLGITLKLAATEVIQFWSRSSQSDNTNVAEGGVRSDTQFSCNITRTY